MKINAKQLGLLQTLYSQLQRRDIGLDGSRESRLAWASELLSGRKLKSFSDLSSGDAGHLIDCAQRALGLPSTAGRRAVKEDRRYALDGRHDGQEFAAQPQIVSGEQIVILQGLYERLGMDQARFADFLRSNSSPLKRRGGEVRTVAEFNKVRFALQHMLKARGLWEERRTA